MQCHCGLGVLALVTLAALSQAYDEELEEYYDEKPSLRDSASKLLERLQQIDGRLTKYFNIVYRSSLTRKRNDILDEETHLAGKRQASSGAQICIWKVCPPSPWRRGGRNEGG